MLSVQCTSVQTKIQFVGIHTALILEYFGLEGAFRGHLAQPPCREQGHLQLDQVAQSPIQPGLECFQGWGLQCLSGQPVLVFHHPRGKKFFPYIQSKYSVTVEL